MNINPEDLLAWLGPAIGPEAFVVTDEVYEIFSQKLPESKATFIKQDDHFFANIYLLASLRLKEAGVTKIYGGEYCTFTQKELFFSYRRDGKNSGRMATLIWLDA